MRSGGISVLVSNAEESTGVILILSKLSERGNICERIYGCRTGIHHCLVSDRIKNKKILDDLVSELT